MKQGKQISAVLFGVLAVFQMFIVRYMMNNAALTGVPIMVLAEIAAAPVFAAACVWLFSRDGVLSPVMHICGARHAALRATGDAD